jgi:hypothetical protein
MQRKALKQKLKSDYWREAMKTILSALVALSVLAVAAAAPVSAAEFDSKKFWQEQSHY